MVISEARVLNLSLVTFRDFEPVNNKMFGLLTQYKVATTAVLMLATMQHSRKVLEKVLEFYGLPGTLDACLAMSLIRESISFHLQLLKGSESVTKAWRHIKPSWAICKTIDEHAPDKRAVIFVM